MPPPIAPSSRTGLSIQRSTDNPTAPATGASTPTEAVPAEEAAAIPGWIVDDDAEVPDAGHAKKTEFLTRLQEAVCAATDKALAGTMWSSQGCPWVDRWFGYYREQSAVHVERAVVRYVPAAAEAANADAYIQPVCDRIAQAIGQWSGTGQVPADLPTDAPPESAAASPPAATGSDNESIARKASDGGAAATDGSPQAVQAQLGSGRALDGGVRSRMSAAFGRDFSGVRVHTDANAAQLSRDLNAHAFAVGQHVAFDAGQYMPGTPAGDALIAHELAHTIQQQGAASAPAARSAGASPARSDDSNLELEADHSAVGAVQSMWAGTKGALAGLGEKVVPSLRSGLRLQRCGNDKKPPSKQTGPDTGPPLPDAAVPEAVPPEDKMKAQLGTILADNQINPAEIASTGALAKSLSMINSDVATILRRDFDLAPEYADLLAELMLTDNPALRALAAGYSSKVAAGAPRRLETDPLPTALAQFLADRSLDVAEFRGLRTLYFVFSRPDLDRALTAQGVGDPTRSQLLDLVSQGISAFNILVAKAGAFPIKLQQGKDKSLSSVGDLRVLIIQTLTESGTWWPVDFTRIHDLLKGLDKVSGAQLLQACGIGATSAAALAIEFTKPGPFFENSVGNKTLLKLSFENTGGVWELTARSRNDLALPWHPTLASPLMPVGGTVTRGNYTASESIGRFTFASKTVADASKLSGTFNGNSLEVVAADELLSKDVTLLDRIDAALSVVPPKHAALIRKLVMDPGNDPGGLAIANSARNGTVNMFFNGAGVQVPQASLNDTTAHEVGHLVSFAQEKKEPGFWQGWEKAMNEDPGGVSRYGFTNELEDFAETYVLYLSGAGADKAKRSLHPKRFAILDKVF
jgi:hypothetical protein